MELKRIIPQLATMPCIDIVMQKLDDYLLAHYLNLVIKCNPLKILDVSTFHVKIITRWFRAG